MTDLKELMNNAVKELEEEENSTLNLAIKDIIRVERNYYYSEKGNSGRLREIRDIVTKYVAIKGNNNAD